MYTRTPEARRASVSGPGGRVSTSITWDSPRRRAFIAVVLNNLQSTKIELQAGEDRRNPQRALLESIGAVKAQLEELERQLRTERPDTPHPALSPEGRG
jgi:hypothetical protein